jgi:hypothetical protein
MPAGHSAEERKKQRQACASRGTAVQDQTTKEATGTPPIGIVTAYADWGRQMQVRNLHLHLTIVRKKQEIGIYNESVISMEGSALGTGAGGGNAGFLWLFSSCY